ncbi:MAG: ZIP family metal transporter, partial [Bacteroidetes bacterium]
MIETITEHFLSVSPIMQALYATTFTWFVTAAGASLVFFIKNLSRRWLDGMLGF